MSGIKFISASAGSGKTHRLMELMAEKVAPKDKNQHAIPAGKLLATTFTEKAAGELRSRVRGKLLECKKAIEAQDVLSGLVGTVNGVSGRLVEEYAFELGLPPDLKVISSSDDGTDFQAVIYQQAIDGVCVEYAAQVEPLARKFDLLPSENARQRNWKSLVSDIVRDARYNAIGPDELGPSIEKSIELVSRLYPGDDEKTFRSRMAEMIDGLRTQLDEILTPAIVNTLYTGFVDCIKQFKAIPQCESYRGVYEFLKETKLKDGAIKKNAKVQSQSALDVYAKLQELLEDKDGDVSKHFMHDRELQHDAISLVELLFEIAGKCMRAYDAFKQEHGLIDFTDQVTLAHKLFVKQGNGYFGRAFKERVKVLMVDEFQDTSPIEMGLFLEMCKLVPDVTFVGDAKQAIYGFKGTDPSLMASVASEVSATGGAGAVETLHNSWRSKQRLLDFSNALFVPAFAADGMTPESVSLTLPDEHKSDPIWQVGEIEVWTLAASSDSKQYAPLSEAIVDFIKREHCEDHLSDIAVLLRTNDECDSIAEALTERGVPVSNGAGILMEQLECRLAMAAYRYAINHDDTVALATLAAYFMPTVDWLAELSVGSGPDRDNVLQRWNLDPRLAALGKVGDRTPLELLDWAIGVIGLTDDVAKRKDSDRRFRNLEALRGLCGRYMTESNLGGYPATPIGFVGYVSKSREKCASAKGGNCVQVMTYHKAKGLEWPTVILATLDHGPMDCPFTQKVVSDQPFGMEDPLAGRCIRMAPNPFAVKQSNMRKDKRRELEKFLCASDGYKGMAFEVEKEGWREMRRLMYVGVTRAKDRLVFAPRYEGENFAIGWLKNLAPGVVNFNFSPSSCSMVIVDGEHTKLRDIPVRDYSTPNPALVLDIPDKFFADDVAGSYQPQLRAYCRPSGEPGKVSGSVAFNVSELSSTLSLKSRDVESRDVDEDSAELGNALHNYYALAVCGKTPYGKEPMGLAKRLCKNWRVQELVDDAALEKSAKALRDYIGKNYPNGEVFTEVPMMLRNDRGQLYQGFIDMLIKVGKDYVLLDHKTGASRNYDKVAKQYAGQLLVYKQAINRATDGKVLKTILHLPVCGVCLECEL